MWIANLRERLSASALVLAVTACGGGDGASVASIPPAPIVPPVSPVPTPAAASQVTIFQNPPAAQFASVGTSTGLVESVTATARFGTLSTADADQLHIRYSSAGLYEIEVPGKAWDTLIPVLGQSPPSDVHYQPASAPQNFGGLFTVPARWSGYRYSEYGNWFSRENNRSGWVAFGIPTPTGGVPTAGSATYQGIVHGSADIMQTDALSAPFYYHTVIDGTVSLAFNFGAGTLAGSMAISAPDGMQPLPLGTFAFKDTVFSVGSQSYSGAFVTSLAGPNYFLGRFTGPAAQETIGTFAVPFTFSTSGQTLQADGQVHTAIGAWVAKP